MSPIMKRSRVRLSFITDQLHNLLELLIVDVLEVNHELPPISGQVPVVHYRHQLYDVTLGQVVYLVEQLLPLLRSQPLPHRQLGFRGWFILFYLVVSLSFLYGFRHFFRRIDWLLLIAGCFKRILSLSAYFEVKSFELLGDCVYLEFLGVIGVAVGNDLPDISVKMLLLCILTFHQLLLNSEQVHGLLDDFPVVRHSITHWIYWLQEGIGILVAFQPLQQIQEKKISRQFFVTWCVIDFGRIFSTHRDLLIVSRTALHSFLRVPLAVCGRISLLAGCTDVAGAKISGERFIHLLGRPVTLGIQSSHLKGVALREQALQESSLRGGQLFGVGLHGAL